MNTAIQNTIAQYFLAFVEKVSGKHNIPKEDLEELWRETQKEKLKISPRSRAKNNATKKPSAYINFCKHHRKQIKDESPGLTFGEVSKALGAKWKSLGVEEKAKYVDPEYVGITTTTTTTAEEKKVKRARKNKE